VVCLGVIVKSDIEEAQVGLSCHEKGYKTFYMKCYFDFVCLDFYGTEICSHVEQLALLNTHPPVFGVTPVCSCLT
jgi:hypothetical protein